MIKGEMGLALDRGHFGFFTLRNGGHRTCIAP